MIHRFSDSESEAYAERQPRGILGMLFRHRVPILVGLGVLLVAAIALVVILPRQFQSSLDILVRNKLPLSARLTASSEETVDEQRMQSELALLHSPELAAKVVDPDYPAQPDATHTAADIGRHQAAVALFSQQLITTVAPNSNIIHVVVTAGDPHRAAELASRLLDVFFASQSEVDHPTPATAFFIAESNRARDAWQQTQLALDTFRLAHPPTPVGSAAEASLQIAALTHQIQRNDEQIDASIGRILTGERKLITIPARPLDRTNKSRNQSAAMPLLSTAQLNAMLAIYTDEQAILLTRPPTDEEAVRASLSLASQIADTNASLQLARQSTPPERDPAANSLWQSTTEEITQASAELKTLYATRTSLATQLAGFQATLDSIQHPPPTLAGLQSKAAALQSAYRLAEQRANEARIADAMDQQLRLNVAVASRPSFSNTATSPSPWLYAATIGLAVIFLGACLTLFAGMDASEYEARERTEDDDEYEFEDSSETDAAHDYGNDSAEDPEDPQQELQFPSRIRSSHSGAFLYAAPGSSVSHTHSDPDADDSLFPDPLGDPLEQAPKLSDILSPGPRSAHDETFHPPFEAAVEPDEEGEPEPHPSPAAEIFHPNQYQAVSPSESPSGEADEAADFDAPPSFARASSGTTHAAVPSFFASPRSGAVMQEEHEEKPGYAFYGEKTAGEQPAVPAAATPVVAAPFGGAPLVETAPPVPEPGAEPILSAVPTPEPEPIVTLPDPTPPWSQPVPEPRPSPLPPLSYWSSLQDAAPAAVAQESSEPTSVEPVPSVSVPTEPIPVEPVQPKPAYTEPAYVPPPVPTTSEVYAAPVQAAPAAVEPKAVSQTFTSTLRPDPFLTSVSSTLSAPAFRFSSPPVRPPAPVAAPPVAPRTPVVSAAPAALRPDPELVVSYASDPIELVPDPVLPPVKPPYQVPRRETPQAFAPEPVLPPASSAASEAASSPDDLSDFPLYRAPKAGRPPAAAAPVSAQAPPVPRMDTPPVPAAASVRAPNRPQTYEEMVRALVFPEEFAPYVPPARPTAAPPRAPAAGFVSEVESRPVVPVVPQPVWPPVSPSPAPPVASTTDDDAPPFHYARKSVSPQPPAPAPVYATPPRREDPETIQNFIRRPSVPLQPSPGLRPAVERDDRTIYRPAEPPPRDDRTTYRPAASSPPQRPAPPLRDSQVRDSQSRDSWIDIAPPPPPRGEALDPQKRAPDRISAIRDSGSRVYPATDRSGVRLTPSQRMKLGRPTTNLDKDGNVTYTDYLNDKDKNRR